MLSPIDELYPVGPNYIMLMCALFIFTRVLFIFTREILMPALLRNGDDDLGQNSASQPIPGLLR